MHLNLWKKIYFILHLWGKIILMKENIYLPDKNRIIDYINLALSLAKRNFYLGEIPVGAVITKNWDYIGSAVNLGKWHAEEILLNNFHGTEMFVTLEPCPSCLFKMKKAHIKKIFWCTENILNKDFKDFLYKISIENWSYNFNSLENSSELLKKFFQLKRI